MLKIIILVETIALIYTIIKWHSCSFTLDVIARYLDKHNDPVDKEAMKKTIIEAVKSHDSLKK